MAAIAQNDSVEIISEPTAVSAFTDLIRVTADEHTDELGFLPAKVYWEAAEQGKLLVAASRRTDHLEYVGHLLYGGVFPHARVFQLFVSPNYRARGIARQLINSLIQRVEASYFLSIAARVADDLPANRAWESLGFRTVKTVRGGQSRRRLLNVRVLDLNTPSLFTLISPIQQQQLADLRLVERLSVRAPQYLIDLNVFFDALRNTPGAADARRLVGAGFGNLIRLAIAEEFVTELERNSMGSKDPVLKFARDLPKLTRPPQSILDNLTFRLAPIVFPERHRQNCMTVQDRSDLVHLATAIHHSACGFVTSEKAILRSREKLQPYFAIDVMGPAELAESLDAPTASEMTDFIGTNVDAEYFVTCLEDTRAADVRDFLLRAGVPGEQIAYILPLGGACGRRRLVSYVDGQVIAYAHFDPLTRPEIDIFIATDEGFPSAETLVDHLLNRVADEVRAPHPLIFKLTSPALNTTVRRVAFAHGFRPASGSEKLHKIFLGRILTVTNWGASRLQLKQVAGVGLPATPPRYDDAHQPLLIETPAQTNLALTLKDLETLMSPTLILLPGRDGVVVPIARKFADELLNTFAQFPMFPLPEAALMNERAYFSRRQNARLLVESTPILFYESLSSGGRGAAIAAGRVVRTEILPKAEVADAWRRRGVLTADEICDIGNDDFVAATTFDNIVRFKNPVTLSQLKDIGYVDPASMITARIIPSEQLSAVVTRGQ